ncbi:DegV family protein [Actinoalloteichus hymeniacidonis]|uniref:EDD domain protein, DegV family n=1 Tax=Actinoalloteichus hymeniacidonis TaxID=340345 RepID=A0AAC9HNA6_9PSEU|nr:DegV family protein [Actinoalloteichus hymeniacidonis]AOS62464.1 EDD domain protein, DegV family [Actinoalloteichus hymeniacidonis]MBB5909505.1 DegV family protein with EDD domain [Actinoalloteichus hymeniacidonis]
MTVAIVTDSTAHLPEGFAERYRVRVVPLHVLVDGRSRRDCVDVGPKELAADLRAHRLVTTSRPTPSEFAAVYRELLRDGAEMIVSVHLSADLSGTWDAAWFAAEELGSDRIKVIDSRSTGMGLGYAVLSAAIAAGSGADGHEAARIAEETALRTRAFFCLDTLEYLRRGGRIGTAAAFLGTALAVRPLLHVDDGGIVPLEKVRTSARALTRLVDHVVETAGSGDVGVAVHHLDAPERAVELASRIEERVPGCRACLISELGAVIGAHTGPGVLGAVVLPGGPDLIG